MAPLQYYSYPGFLIPHHPLHKHTQTYHPPGGWDPTTSLIPAGISAEIDRAFFNVDHALKHAGGQGWSQVYKIRIYLTDLGEEFVEACVRNLKIWCLDHRPILTCVGVKGLALEGMRVEIEVVALVGGEEGGDVK